MDIRLREYFSLLCCFVPTERKLRVPLAPGPRPQAAAGCRERAAWEAASFDRAAAAYAPANALACVLDAQMMPSVLLADCNGTIGPERAIRKLVRASAQALPPTGNPSLRIWGFKCAGVEAAGNWPAWWEVTGRASAKSRSGLSPRSGSPHTMAPASCAHGMPRTASHGGRARPLQVPGPRAGGPPHSPSPARPRRPARPGQAAWATAPVAPTRSRRLSSWQLLRPAKSRSKLSLACAWPPAGRLIGRPQRPGGPGPPAVPGLPSPGLRRGASPLVYVAPISESASLATIPGNLADNRRIGEDRAGISGKEGPEEASGQRACGEGLVNRRLPHAAREISWLQVHWPRTQGREPSGMPYVALRVTAAPRASR
jgi:hypothetical protein